MAVELGKGVSPIGYEAAMGRIFKFPLASDYQSMRAIAYSEDISSIGADSLIDRRKRQLEAMGEFRQARREIEIKAGRQEGSYWTDGFYEAVAQEEVGQFGPVHGVVVEFRHVDEDGIARDYRVEHRLRTRNGRQERMLAVTRHKVLEMSGPIPFAQQRPQIVEETQDELIAVDGINAIHLSSDPKWLDHEWLGQNIV